MNSFSRIILTGIVAAGSCNVASALTVNVQPGGLSEAVSAQASVTEVTDLAVTGSINIADFEFLSELTSLKSVDLSGTTIAAYTGDKVLTGVTTSAANVLPDCAFLSSSCTSIALPSGITEIGAAAFGGTKLESLTIPATVTKIGTGAFSSMTSLKTLTIPATVTTIGERILKDCTALTSVVISAPLTTLPASTFQNCSALTSVTLPSTLTAIGNEAFAGCTSLAKISLPKSVTSIGDMAFANTALTEIDLSKVTSVGAWAFSNCSELKSISTDLAITSLGEGAFFNNSKLETSLGDLASEATEIPNYLLYGATSATATEFSNTQVETIGNYALSGLTVEEIALPATLTSLGDGAMERWSQIKRIDAASLTDVPTLGESVWAEVDQANTVLLVDSATVSAFQDAPQWQEFKIEQATASQLEITAADKATNNVRAYFDGVLLLVETDLDINGAQLYDVSGRCINIVRNAQSNRLTIDTAPFDARVYILRLHFANGTTAVLKLAR
jgi:hypothetical protein